MDPNLCLPLSGPKERGLWASASAVNRETAPPFAALRIQSPQLCTHTDRPSDQEQEGVRARTKVSKITPWCKTQSGERHAGSWWVGLRREDIPLPVNTNIVCQEGTINTSCLWSQDPLWGKRAMTFHVLPFLSFFFAIAVVTLFLYACFLFFFFKKL